MVQRLSASIHRKTRDWARIRVRIFKHLFGLIMKESKFVPSVLKIFGFRSQVREEEIWGVVFSEHCSGSCGQGLQDLQNYGAWSEAREEDFQACRRDFEAEKSLRGWLVVTGLGAITFSGKLERKRKFVLWKNYFMRFFSTLIPWFLAFI